MEKSLQTQSVGVLLEHDWSLTLLTGIFRREHYCEDRHMGEDHVTTEAEIGASNL